MPEAGSPDLSTLLNVLLGYIIVFGKRVGKDESEAYDTHDDP